MEENKPKFYKISEVATRWNKTLDEILLMMEHGKLTACYRYIGFYFYGSKEDEFISMADLPEEETATLSVTMEAIEGVFGKVSNVRVCRAPKYEQTISPTKFYNSADGLCADGFFTLPNNKASLLRLSGEANVGVLHFHMEVLPGLSLGLPFGYSFLYVAIETQFDGKPAWKRGMHKVKIDDLCFFCLEIARIEEEQPSLFVKPDFIASACNTSAQGPKDQAEMTLLASEHAKALQKENHQGYKPPGGWVLYLTKWVKENAPKNLELTDTACKKIATIANPDKSKGPGKTKG